MRTALWVPSDSPQDLDTVAAIAQARHWQVESIIHQWDDWLTLVRRGGIDLGLMTSRGILPVDRTPRLITVDEAIQLQRPRPRRLR